MTLTIDRGLLENGTVVRDHCRAGLLVIGIGIARAGARAALDEHLVAALDELIGGGRQQRHAVFVVFDFLWDANDHNDASIPVMFSIGHGLDLMR